MASRLLTPRHHSVCPGLPPLIKTPITSINTYSTLPLSSPIEEETLPYYNPQHYYPVKLGDIYNTRYQITTKQGYGAYSTTWLSLDLQFRPSLPFKVIIWDLFEGEHLFGDIFDAKGGHDPFRHLALMVAYLGSPPGEFMGRSETTEQCFGRDGVWIAHEEAAIPAVSLESKEKRLSGEEKDSFIRFIRSMLRWLPEERKTAKQLLEDPWLLA
ncbi:uncharacterized protein BO97DRAFT_475361 [Aspergillus homomorphus CBS 101889]|uniref:non-specific serine/threonine protein kinase n=1 Tax=Aspergillus homomorphus (strain CBS 101889) TaxID=1450537 RepID=A0A395I9H6_ASPHC|nr:hypothetical protein BO97DRAFT_475361 [Aspergillus homomorphus CBS 101889]RAL16615.1 hypothetical protein BO97DRAFT_475361 [Aspergillus homomorphus CBS 101889]